MMGTHITTHAFRRLACAAVAAVCLAASASCGEVARTGRSPVYLIIDSLRAAPGDRTGDLSGTLNSDVRTNGTVFNDVGSVTLRLGLKNPGTPSNPNSPSSLNQVTITRYRVSFRRADGRNTPGVHVPFGFDGSLTLTVSGTQSATAGFELVRHQMKLEPPLAALAGGGGVVIISTIADVTFFGRDAAGHEVNVTGSISVNFGDFADP